jgi:hypothetical protein
MRRGASSLFGERIGGRTRRDEDGEMATHAVAVEVGGVAEQAGAAPDGNHWPMRSTAVGSSRGAD